MRKSKKEWWQDVFDEKYLKTYVDIITPQVTEPQVNFIHKVLGSSKNQEVLDLACGYGRISIALAKLGYNVTGLDYSRYFLERAKAEARKEGIKVNFIRRDMRDLNFKEKFDAVINIFTSFGYFNNEEDNIKVIRKVYRSLNSGGKFLIDLNNMARTISLMAESGKVGKDGRLYGPVRKQRLSNGLIVTTRDIADATTLRWSMTRIWKEKNKKRSYATEVRLYSLPELKRLLEENGLKVRKVWGDFKGSKFSFASRRLIVLAEKQVK